MLENGEKGDALNETMCYDLGNNMHGKGDMHKE
jgi:hypothetical protein